jgi:hypothetical protein
VIENVIDHGGSFARIADWLLECLDLQPPPAGGHLVIYLCYHFTDRGLFSSPERSEELGQALLGTYRREFAWDGKGFGDLRFDLRKDQAGYLLLTLRDPEHFAGEFTESWQKPLKRPTAIEFSWQESETNILPGAIGLARRWITPLESNTVMTAVFSVVSNGSTATAHHIHIRQRQVRTSPPSIYLPEGVTSVTIGPIIGSDIWVPDLQETLKFEYFSSSDEWRWVAPSAPWLGSGNQTGDLSQDFADRNGERSIVVKGQRLPQRSTLAEIKRKNELPSFVVEIIGCLLPSPNEQVEWAGNIAGGQPALAAVASSAIELPGGNWLYCNRDSSATYLLPAGERPPGTLLKRDGPIQELRSHSANGPQLKGKWMEFTRGLLPYFRGEFRLMPPLTSRLAADAICGDLPGEIFPDYVDKSIGRPPCRLESGDGRSYTLAFNPSARHSVFLFSKTSSRVTRYDPSSSRVIELGTGADFILGATHYRLRQLSENVSDEAF